LVLRVGQAEIPPDGLLLDRFERPGAVPRIAPLPT
jgi:hypothetical protein